MTKTIRIENACNSNFHVDVEVWDMNSNGPTLVEVKQLNHPTAMATEYITNSRWLVIRERPTATKI